VKDEADAYKMLSLLKCMGLGDRGHRFFLIASALTHSDFPNRPNSSFELFVKKCDLGSGDNHDKETLNLKFNRLLDEEKVQFQLLARECVLDFYNEAENFW
jgi:hypothetical protein